MLQNHKVLPWPFMMKKMYKTSLRPGNGDFHARILFGFMVLGTRSADNVAKYRRFSEM
jgi:hypothetical protein